MIVGVEHGRVGGCCGCHADAYYTAIAFTVGNLTWVISYTHPSSISNGGIAHGRLRSSAACQNSPNPPRSLTRLNLAYTPSHHLRCTRRRDISILMLKKWTSTSAIEIWTNRNIHSTQRSTTRKALRLQFGIASQLCIPLRQNLLTSHWLSRIWSTHLTLPHPSSIATSWRPQISPGIEAKSTLHAISSEKRDRPAKGAYFASS